MKGQNWKRKGRGYGRGHAPASFPIGPAFSQAPPLPQGPAPTFLLAPPRRRAPPFSAGPGRGASRRCVSASLSARQAGKLAAVKMAAELKSRSRSRGPEGRGRALGVG